MMQVRLIIDETPRSGAQNMELDSGALGDLEADRSSDAASILRLYRWNRPTVSLGRFQPLDEVDTSFAQDHGIDIVRRPTGGKGVLHDDELTYAFVSSTRFGIPEGVNASYEYIARALISAFEDLGVSPGALDRGNPQKSEGTSSGACYLAASGADISANAAKLSGSAQVWRKDTVLQHGCFQRTRSVELEAGLFKLTDAEARLLEVNATSLEEITGRLPSFEEMVNAVVKGFESALDVEFI